MSNIVGTGIRMTSKQNAFKESVFDTGIGMSINIPLNWVMLTLGLYWELGALELSIIMTTVFTAFAITRKYYVRVHFNNKEHKARTKLLHQR
jgi:O-antigen/teichoic acid export membrane protein